MPKKKILMVDDEVSLTRMVKLNLESTGQYEMRTENKGAQALDAARAFKPDLVFLDIVMPDVEGSEVARQLKEDPVLKNTPIVFMTATVTTEELDQTGSLIGGMPFIAKPVNVKQLIDCIEKHTKK